MNRITRFPLRRPHLAHRSPTAVIEAHEDGPVPARRLPLMDVLAIVTVLALAAVLYLLLMWLSIDIVEPVSATF